MNTDTDALIQTVREVLRYWPDTEDGTRAEIALDSLAAELKRWKFDAEKASADYWAAEDELTLLRNQLQVNANAWQEKADLLAAAEAELERVKAERDSANRSSFEANRLLHERTNQVDKAEGIIHSALVTNSDPIQALRDAMDALGGESIPVATG